jgi:hypothetical protein
MGLTMKPAVFLGIDFLESAGSLLSADIESTGLSLERRTIKRRIENQLQ